MIVASLVSVATLVPALLFAAFVVLPAFVTNYVISFLIITFMLIILAMSWNVFSGFTGYISLGHGLFFGAGAYTFALCVVRADWSPWVAIPMAAVVSALLAFFIGTLLLTIRIKIAYFAMITLGLNEIFQAICANSEMLGESYGFTLPPIPSLSIPYYIFLALTVLLIAGTFVLSRSDVGLALKSIFQDEEVAETLGVNSTLLKVSFFVISAIVPGIAGGVMAWFWSYIDPYMAFDLLLSFQMAIMAILGGMGTVLGPAIAAVFMSGLIEILSTHLPHFHNILFGALVTAMIIITPRGMNALVYKIFGLGVRR